MSLSMYDASVPVLDKMLANLSRVLGKAAAYGAARKIDPEILLQARLYPDMFPLVRQVQVACDLAKGAAGRLSGQEPPKFADEEKTFVQIGERIERTQAYIRGVPAAAIAESAGRPIVLKLGDQEMRFTGKDYLLDFVFPNFFFHVTTSYDILRHVGLDIGKRDYLGW
jgi:hypothetical protein